MKKNCWLLLIAGCLSLLPAILFAQDTQNYYNGYSYGYSKGMNDEFVYAPTKNADFNSGANEGYQDAQQRRWKEQQEEQQRQWQQDMDEIDRQTDEILNEVDNMPVNQEPDNNQEPQDTRTPEEVEQENQAFLDKMNAMHKQYNDAAKQKQQEEKHRQEDRQFDTIFGAIMGVLGVGLCVLFYKIVKKIKRNDD